MEASNAKAIREALVGLAQAVQDFMATKGRNFYPDMAVALDAAAAALAAPERNCDRYPTVAEARNAFICEPCEHPCGDCTVCDDDYALCRPCGIKWLFDPAKEGKTDGGK